MKAIDEAVAECLVNAVERSFKALFAEKSESFYYCTLVMQELAVPYISAMSYEALEGLAVSEADRDMLKWSYADSPYCGYGFDEYFGEVSQLFEKRFAQKCVGGESFIEAEYECWINSMEKAMSLLDEKGIFGTGDVRKGIFINAEIMPPEPSNAERGQRLNPKAAYEMWSDDMNGAGEKSAVDWDEIWWPELCDVILTKPVTDRKTMMIIKKALNYSEGMTKLEAVCKNSQSVIVSGERYKAVMDIMGKYPELESLISVKRIKK